MSAESAIHEERRRVRIAGDRSRAVAAFAADHGGGHRGHRHRRAAAGRLTSGSRRRLSTVALSQGQRKRLALLTALLEDRPIYVFDEWAADQEPGFREWFYTRILSQLKARGKTVVVITHDDRYFDCADQIVRLDFGQREDVIATQESMPEAGAQAR